MVREIASEYSLLYAAAEVCTLQLQEGPQEALGRKESAEERLPPKEVDSAIELPSLRTREDEIRGMVTNSVSLGTQGRGFQ